MLIHSIPFLSLLSFDDSTNRTCENEIEFVSKGINKYCGIDDDKYFKKISLVVRLVEEDELNNVEFEEFVEIEEYKLLKFKFELIGKDG